MLSLAIMAVEPISFTPSANIQAITYDADTQTLLVRFHRGGRLYRYVEVTGEEAYGFGQALSANDYLQTRILPAHPGEAVNENTNG